MGNRALRRQQTRSKEGKKAKRGGAQRAMPSTGPRTQSRAAAGRGGILSWRPRFLIDIFTELRKVVWPQREDVVYLTFVVVVVTIIMGALLGAIDIGFGWIIDETLLN